MVMRQLMVINVTRTQQPCDNVENPIPPKTGREDTSLDIRSVTNKFGKDSER
jgi:hypothetical protein